MATLKSTTKSEFENIVLLIQEAKGRAFSKVNTELVMLYYNVGSIVSSKVADGIWGEGTVDELANFIALKMLGMSGFNRRGLYRMKQFYETYSDPEFVSRLATQLEAYFEGKKASALVTASPTLMRDIKVHPKKVSALRTQLNDLGLLTDKFVSTLLTQINWTNHRLILAKN